MSSHLPPIEVAARLIGNIEAVARICMCDGKSFYAYRHPSKHRDAGDLASTRHQRALLAHSARHQLGLTADHLIFGASEDEVAAILAARPPVAEYLGAAE